MGDFITQACARAGLDVYTFKTFPAEIKGGYAMYQVRASTEHVHNQGDIFDVLCAFNGDAYNNNRAFLRPGTAIVYDSPGDFTPDIPEGVHAYPIPMTQTAKELNNPRAKNMVAMGALSVLFNIPVESLREVLTAKFARKGEDVVQGNLKALERGRELAAALKKTDPWIIGTPKSKNDVIVMSGNNAIGLGAIIAGLDFFSAYPITPATEVAIYVAKHLPKRGGTLIQAEDEIASISQVLGASYAGKKAMTSTSGPACR